MNADSRRQPIPDIGAGPFDQYREDGQRPSPAALSELNAQHAKAKDCVTRDAIEAG
jgi:hypothetical protein